MSKSRVKKGVKLSEKSLQSRFANPKLRKRGLVRFFEQGGGTSVTTHAAQASDENEKGQRK